MSRPWKIWFGVLAVISAIVAIGGLDYYHGEWEADNALAAGAPQQMVAAQWHTNGLLTVLTLEFLFLLIGIATYSISRSSPVATNSVAEREIAEVA